MKDGFCDECGSDDLLRDTGRRVETHVIGRVTVQDVICLTCGYMQTFITQQDLQRIRQRQRERSTDLFDKRKNDELL